MSNRLFNLLPIKPSQYVVPDTKPTYLLLLPLQDVNGVATLVTTITPMGHSDAFDLAHRLRPLTESDICEASRGGGTPLFTMFCRNSFDRSVKVYLANEVPVAQELGAQLDAKFTASGQAFSV
jgi:hypothetical protein